MSNFVGENILNKEDALLVIQLKFNKYETIS